MPTKGRYNKCSTFTFTFVSSGAENDDLLIQFRLLYLVGRKKVCDVTGPID